MVPQTFAPTDLPIIGFLILLEGLLSADNALVLAIMVRHLPKEQQKKALLYGLGGAFVFRFLAILLVTQIIGLWWLQLIGAGYLIWVGLKHFASHANPGKKVARATGFWGTVAAVELADIAFAVDSVVAAVALVGAPDKLWVVYTGAILGVILLRIAAGFFIALLERYPGLDHMAYALVGWVGVKLVFMAGHNFVISWNRDHLEALAFSIPEMDAKVFWGVMGLIIVVGSLLAVRQGKAAGSPSPETTTVPLPDNIEHTFDDALNPDPAEKQK